MRKGKFLTVRRLIATALNLNGRAEICRSAALLVHRICRNAGKHAVQRQCRLRPLNATSRTVAGRPGRTNRQIGREHVKTVHSNGKMI